MLRVQIALGPQDSRTVAKRLWDLDALAARYRQVMDGTQALTARASRLRPGAEAFRAFAAATLPVYEVSADDPDLPAELLPPDWPADELTGVLGQAFRTFSP